MNNSAALQLTTSKLLHPGEDYSIELYPNVTPSYPSSDCWSTDNSYKQIHLFPDDWLMMKRLTVVQSLHLNRLPFVLSFHVFVNQDRRLPASEISGAAERVHQLLLTIQVVNSKPTQLTQNEKSNPSKVQYIRCCPRISPLLFSFKCAFHSNAEVLYILFT